MDLVFIGAAVLFFALTVAMVTGCGKLGGKQWISSTSSARSRRPACWRTWWWPCWKRRTS